MSKELPTRKVVDLSSVPIDIARTKEQISQGLAGKKKIMRPMLFLMGHPGPHMFWMKGCLVPLDMVFIDSEGIATSVHHNVPPPVSHKPGSDITISRRRGSGIYVLEMAGGSAKKLNITTGTRVILPALSPD